MTCHLLDGIYKTKVECFISKHSTQSYHRRILFTDFSSYPRNRRQHVHQPFLPIKKDGSLWGWGYNRFGQLCTGNSEPVLFPVKISDNVKDYCPFYATLYFVKQDNTLWGSGFNISSFSNDQPELTPPVLLQENIDHIQTIDDTVFSFGTDGSLSICGYHDVVRINDGFDSPYEIDRRKILDNVAWIDGERGDIFAMTNDGKLMNFSVVTVYDGKVQPTKPVEIPLPLT